MTEEGIKPLPLTRLIIRPVIDRDNTAALDAYACQQHEENTHGGDGDGGCS